MSFNPPRAGGLGRLDLGPLEDLVNPPPAPTSSLRVSKGVRGRLGSTQFGKGFQHRFWAGNAWGHSGRELDGELHLIK